MAWHKVASSQDVEEGNVIEVKVGETPIALYNIDGEFYATHNICTHAYACLHEGYVEDETIECPLHQGIFDIKTGEALEGPVEEPLETYSVKREGEEIYIEVPEE
ncbi:Rieske (2Fe-2S) protein [Fodinicurvata halophila]|uniref:Rieske (2Fe-2S) protein n=1 Tax=Fodinicurvata halophila TaxID=1419723 RepID=A0ABV8UJX6_9PROT